MSQKKYPEPSPIRFPHRLYDRLTFGITAKRADAVVVSSPIEYEEALEFGIDKNRLHVIPDGIEISDSEIKQPAREGAPLHLLFAGPMTRTRRVELLLQAARKLTLPFRITLAATNNVVETPGSAEYVTGLRKRAKTLGIEDRVDILDTPSPEDLNHCYANADLFINPSAHETSGKTLLEAGVRGLPIISTPVGLANEIINSGQNGFVVPADPDMICDRILQLSKPGARKPFGKHIRQKVLDGFGWSAVMNRYMELYGSLK